MLENFGLSAAALFILGGAFLLLDATSTPDASAPFRLLAGAAVVAAGVIAAALTIRSKLYWRRIQKQNHDRT